MSLKHKGEREHDDDYSDDVDCDDDLDFGSQTDLILLGRNLCHTDNRADCAGEQKRQKDRGKKEQLEENNFRG